jgi:hypothetical protein
MMNFARALHDIAEHGVTDIRARIALARDTIYLPSELAARLLPIREIPDVDSRDGERLVWDATALGAGRRSPAH